MPNSWWVNVHELDSIQLPDSSSAMPTAIAFGTKDERELLDLGRRLEQRDGEADDQRGEQHRRGQLGGDQHGLHRDLGDVGVGHAGPRSSSGA